MIEQKEFNEILSFKNQVIDSTLFVGILLGVLTFIVSLFKIPSAGLNVYYLTDFLCLFILSIIYLFRKKVSLQVKTSLILAGVFIVIVTKTIGYGVCPIQIKVCWL